MLREVSRGVDPVAKNTGIRVSPSPVAVFVQAMDCNNTCGKLLVTKQLLDVCWRLTSPNNPVRHPPEVCTDFLNGHTSACCMLYILAVRRFFRLAFSSLCNCIIPKVKSGSMAPATPLYSSARAGQLGWTALWHSGSAHRQLSWCQICRSRPIPFFLFHRGPAWLGWHWLVGSCLVKLFHKSLALGAYWLQQGSNGRLYRRRLALEALLLILSAHFILFYLQVEAFTPSHLHTFTHTRQEHACAKDVPLKVRTIARSWLKQARARPPLLFRVQI
jgi:hypothetical protein